MSAVPDCDSECGEMLRRDLRVLGLDVHVTHIPLLVASGYEDLDMSCPHGVRWHVQPTGEQIAKFIEEGTP